MGGTIQKRIYLVEHPQGLDASQKRQRIAQDAGGYIKHPDPQHWIQLDSTNNPTGDKNRNKRRNIGMGGYRKPKPKICHRKELAANAISIPTKRIFGERYQKATTEKTKQRDMEARGSWGFHQAPLLTA